jgi:MFS family permease
MSWVDSILKPFGAAGRSPRHKTLRLLLLLGAPLALLSGVWLQHFGHRRGAIDVTLDRPQALRIAHQVASANGLKTEGWKEYVVFAPRAMEETYFQQPQRGRDHRSRQLAPVAVVMTLLERPDQRSWVRVTMGPQGFVTAFVSFQRDVPAPVGGTTDAQARPVAEAALREWIGDMEVARMGQPESSSTEEAGAAGARRYIWRAQPRNQPELEFVFTFDVQGDRLIRREVVPNFAPSFIAREVSPRQAMQQFGGVLRSLLLVLIVLYACYRYTRRSMEKEAPHRRVFVLTVTMLLFGVILIVTDPYIGQPDLRPDRMHGAIFYATLFSILLVTTLQGLLLGIAYGAGEGDVREAWPGKLTSLDAVLTGRIFSANAGRAVVIGTVIGFWAFGLSRLGDALLPNKSLSTPYGAIAYTFGRIPLLIFLLNLPVLALFNSAGSLLVPLTFLRRHVRSRRLQAVLLGVAAVALGNLGEVLDLASPTYWLHSAVLAAAILSSFFLADYLAVVVSITLLSFLGSLLLMADLLPYWRDAMALAAAIAAASLLPFAYAAWRGREVSEEEVEPAHARNLTERLSLQAELGAAREAQLRLLPERPPQVPGFSIAASCTPAREVGGDFYDFFPLTDGRLGIIVAEGGNDGLASALTIALAKGFLMYEAAANLPMEQTLLRLERTLGRYLDRDSGRTSLALIVLEPRQSAIRMGRIGAYPRLLVLSEDRSVAELTPKPHASGEPFESAHLELMPGDSVFICTDGLIRLLGRTSHDTPESLLRRAATNHHIDSAGRLHDLVIDFLLPGGERPRQDLPDDLTAVVLRYDSVEAATLEGVA